MTPMYPEWNPEWNGGASQSPLPEYNTLSIGASRSGELIAAAAASSARVFPSPLPIPL